MYNSPVSLLAYNHHRASVLSFLQLGQCICGRTNDNVLQLVIIFRCFISTTSDSCSYSAINFPLVSVTEYFVKDRFSIYSTLDCQRAFEVMLLFEPGHLPNEVVIRSYIVSPIYFDIRQG